MTIPLYVVEEHHEAFYVWHQAIREGRLPARGNTLLHVDEHADIGTPRLHRSIDEVGEDLRELRQFTYDQLSCFEFIVPAVYQQMFGELYWIQHAVPQRRDQVVIVQSPNGGGRTFDLRAWDVGVMPALKPGQRVPNGGWARYRHQTIADPFAASGAVILDVDLDYFSCEDAVNLVQKLEVSREEYDSFHGNPYHFLRVSQGSRIRMREEEGRYYVYLRSYPEAMPTPLKVGDDEVLRRIDAFVDYLRQYDVQPVLVDFARSRYSGYTPREQWEFIERNLIAGLERLYSLDVRTPEQVAASFA